jgi:hypothetical protein
LTQGCMRMRTWAMDTRSCFSLQRKLTEVFVQRLRKLIPTISTWQISCIGLCSKLVLIFRCVHSTGFNRDRISTHGVPHGLHSRALLPLRNPPWRALGCNQRSAH